MPDQDRNVVEVPLLEMFQNFTKQIDGLETRVMGALDKLVRQIDLDRQQSVRRLEELENWRIRHESGDGHPAITAELRAADKRLDALEQDAREEKAREETRTKEQRKREEQAAADQATRDKRTNIRIAIASILAIVAGAVAALAAPLLTGHH